MLKLNRTTLLDRRDEMIMAVIAIMIPLATLPAMIG
jgi:hypothetical protein